MNAKGESKGERTMKRDFPMNRLPMHCGRPKAVRRWQTAGSSASARQRFTPGRRDTGTWDPQNCASYASCVRRMRNFSAWWPISRSRFPATSLSERIRAFRRKKGWSIRQAAQNLGVDPCSARRSISQPSTRSGRIEPMASLRTI